MIVERMDVLSNVHCTKKPACARRLNFDDNLPSTNLSSRPASSKVTVDVNEHDNFMAAELLRKSEAYNFDFLHERPMQTEQSVYEWTETADVPEFYTRRPHLKKQAHRSRELLNVTETESEQSPKRKMPTADIASSNGTPNKKLKLCPIEKATPSKGSSPTGNDHTDSSSATAALRNNSQRMFALSMTMPFSNKSR